MTCRAHFGVQSIFLIENIYTLKFKLHYDTDFPPIYLLLDIFFESDGHLGIYGAQKCKNVRRCDVRT